MFNEVEIDEYEDDEFLSVFFKITKVRREIVPKFSSSGKK